MNKYIIEILKIQNSVILPGLGALMVPSQKSGKIVFNQHLKFNDGSLARFIAEQEGIEEQEAQNKVAKFVREIEAELGKGNSYDMFQFGNFYKNNDGEVDFKMYSAESKPITESGKTESTADKVSSPNPVKKEETKESKKAEDKKKEKKISKKQTEEEVETTKTSKQSKNKFVPPVTEDTISDLSDKAEESIDKTTAKIEDKVEDKNVNSKEKISGIQKKVEEVKSATEKGIGAILHDAKDKIETPKETTKPTEEKKTITPPVIANSKTEDKDAEDKQRKNTFIPPVSENETKDKSKTEKTIAAAATTVNTDDSSNANKKESPKKTTVVVEEKKKRSKLPWIILLLLLIGLGVAGYFFRDKIMAMVNGDEATTADSTVIDDSTSDNTTTIPVEYEDTLTNEVSDDIDTNSNDALQDDLTEITSDLEGEDTAPVDENPVDENPPAVSGTNNGSYHLIGNSFGEESNADRYAKQMQDKGYPAKVLGRFDGLYMVSLKSYDTREAAQSGRSSVAADASSAWVFKYSK